MVIVFISALVFLFIGALAIYSNFFSLSKNLCKGVMAALLVFSVLFPLVGVAAFIVGSLRDKESFSSETFVFMSLVVFVFVAVCFVITLVSSILKTRLRPLVLFINPMWGAVAMGLTVVLSLWVSYSDKVGSYLLALTGAMIAFILCLPVHLEMRGRMQLLSDENACRAIEKARRDRREKRRKKAEERRTLREKKRRLSHPSKRK